MKRIISLIIALAMLLSVTAVFAEDANEAAFKENLQNMFNRVDLNTKALTLVDVKGNAVAELQAKDGLADLNIPGAFEIQADQENLWISANGQVYQLPISELEATIQELYAMFIPAANAKKTVNDMLSLLIEKTITPGISLDFQTGAITIHLTGEQMLQGLAEFGDAVVANPEYLSLCNVGYNWMQLLGALVNSGNYRYRGPSIYTAEQLAAQWPALREQILATKSDLVIDGSITGTENTVNFLLTAVENEKELVRLEGSLTQEGDTVVTSYTLTAGTVVYTVEGKTTGSSVVATYSLKDNGKELFTATVNLTIDENSVAGTFEGALNGAAFNGDLNINMATGEFACNLEVPEQSVKVALNGTVAADSLKAALVASDQNGEVANLSLDAARNGSDISLDLNGSVAGANLAYTLRVTASGINYNMVLDAQGISASVNYNIELVEGDFPHFRIETVTANGYYSTSAGYCYDGAEFKYWNDNMSLTFRGAFVSPTEYQLTGEMVQSYYGSTYTSTIVLSAVLEDSGDDWTIQFKAVVDDSEPETASLKYGPQSGFEPLADKVTQNLTKDLLLQMLFQPQAVTPASYSY